MLQNGCENVIEQPTRVTSNTSTLIDLCFTDFSKSASCSGVLCSGLSDHLPIFVALPIATRTQCTNNTIRIINDGGKKTFHSLVDNLNWANVYKEPDPSVSYDIFMSELQICYDAAFPLTTIVRHKKARKEWITNDLFKRIKHKDKLFEQFLRTRDIAKLQEFKRFRNKLSSDLKKAKCRFYQHKFEKCADNPRKTWKQFNELNATHVSGIPFELVINGAKLS